MSKRKFLTLDERVKVLKLFSDGKSGRTIAEEMGVGKTQIQGIIKRKREIMDEYDNNANTDFKRPRRATTYDDINELCLKWFQDATGRKVNVSGPLLKERALKYANELGVENFKASNGWLDSFLKRNNIVFKTMSGERGAVDPNVVTNWKDKLPTLCEGFEPANIFNMDETGLFFRDSTKSTYFKKGEDCAGGKRSKERITIALCASMTGEKVMPLVIGKSRKPRCFSRISTDKLPVMYRANKTAWMTTYVYEEWLRWFDRKMNGRKVLLFIDNAPAHGSLQLKNVTVKYLPANTTSLSQPMDQGIIQTLKLKYRKRQLQFVNDQMDIQPGTSGPDLLKSISLLDAIYWVAKSWDNVETSTVVKCFDKCGFESVRLSAEQGLVEHSDASTSDSVDDDAEEDDDIPLHLHLLARQLFDCSIKELLDIDKSFLTCDSEVKNWDRPAAELLKDSISEHDEEDDDEIDCEVDSVSACSLAECVGFVEKLKRFAVNNGHGDLLNSVMDCGDILTNITMQSMKKQTKISDFFVKRT